VGRSTSSAIHRSAQKRNSANFAVTEFSEVRPKHTPLAHKLQRLAAALNHRALLLHESLLPNREVETVGQGMKKSEATYPFGVSLCSVKRHASMDPSIVN
jgi:hypothetical protein